MTTQAQVLDFYSRPAAMTSAGRYAPRAPDASFAEIGTLYENDERLRVPATVFNAVWNRSEAI